MSASMLLSRAGCGRRLVNYGRIIWGRFWRGGCILGRLDLRSRIFNGRLVSNFFLYVSRLCRGFISKQLAFRSNVSALINSLLCLGLNDLRR